MKYLRHYKINLTVVQKEAFQEEFNKINSSLNEIRNIGSVASYVSKIVGEDLLTIKNELDQLKEEHAMYMASLLRILVPAIDEVTTKKAQEIYGNANKFNQHKRAGNISPVRCFGKKSKTYWSRVDIYNLKRAEQLATIIKIV